MCVPRFDGEPLFGRLVGGPDAGTFRLGPADPATVIARRYRPGTATLETTWRTEHGRLTLTEGMVADVAGGLLPSTLLVRRLTAEDGPVTGLRRLRPSPRRTAPQAAPAAPRRDPRLRLGRDRRGLALRPATCRSSPGAQ